MIEDDVFLWSDDAAPAAAGPRRAQGLVVRMANGVQVAFAPHHVFEVVEQMHVAPLPGARPAVHGLLAWHEQWIALVDLQASLQPAPAAALALPRRALVLGYTLGADSTLHHVAIGLDALPFPVEVSDADACPLPAECEPWRDRCLACFQHAGAGVPVLDIAATFAASAASAPVPAFLPEESAFAEAPPAADGDIAFDVPPEDPGDSLWAD